MRKRKVSLFRRKGSLTRKMRMKRERTRTRPAMTRLKTREIWRRMTTGTMKRKLARVKGKVNPPRAK